MNKLRKIACLLLALLTVSSAFAACSEGSNTDAKETQGNAGGDEAAVTTAAEETEIVYKATVPEGTNLDGYKYRVMVNDSSQYWADQNFVHDEENGNYINDSVLRRERAVEDILGCDIIPTPMQSVSSTTQKFVSANEDSADLVFISPVASAGLVTNGTFLELTTMEGLDLSNPWWDQNAAADLSIANKLFMAYGDISMMYKRTMSVVCFNKDIVRNNQLTSPYELVEQDNWTTETMAALCKGVAQDLNSDGNYVIREDLIGASMTPDQFPISLIAGGNFITVKDEDDIPQLTFYNEKMVSHFEALTAWLFNPELATVADSGANTDSFGEGKLFLQFCEMHCIPHQRNSETDFGLLPFPKMDASQDRYYHVINPNVACAMLVPVTVSNPAQVALVAEVLGAEGKNWVTPAYYDYNLTSRDTRDEESVAMLDIIFDTTKYDVAHIYDLAGMGSQLRSVASNKTENITSVYEKIEKRLTTEIEKIVEKYTEIGEE